MCSACLLCVAAVALDDDGYPRAKLLVEPSALANSAAREAMIILDARPRAKFDAGRLAGARWVDHAEWEKAVGSSRDPHAWAKRIGALGIAGDRPVAVYDDMLSRDAARIWWILKYFGVADVRILHGGWKGVQNAKLPTETRSAPVAPAAFDPKPHAARFADKAWMKQALAAGTQVVDARSEKEFCGIEKLKNRRAGAMPGAKLLEWSDLLDRETARFKSPRELRELFAKAGVDLDRPTATHCQGGGRAAVMAFGMELMGAVPVRNYYASWGEWGNADDTPIVTPKGK